MIIGKKKVYLSFQVEPITGRERRVRSGDTSNSEGVHKRSSQVEVIKVTCNKDLGPEVVFTPIIRARIIA
jgi:hypothetical protein